MSEICDDFSPTVQTVTLCQEDPSPLMLTEQDEKWIYSCVY